LLALCASAGAAATGYGKGGDFTLNAPDGPLSLSDLRGKVVLIFFGYTSCPDVCPISLARIDACFSAMDEEELERVRALFITLDPERDTPDRLEKYTSFFHPNIIGLRADVEVIDAVTDQYGVEYSKDMMPDSALGYSISHPTDILLLDYVGRIVEAIPHDAKSKYILARIRDLLNASD
jgi:protein SCO1/2